MQIAVFTVGAINILIGLTIFAAPGWFYETVGEFPPYNRHYMGDVASFLLPYGVGLVFAARDLLRYRAVIGLAGLASVLHLLNHAYDALGGLTHAHWLVDLTPLVLLAGPLVAVYFRRTPQDQAVAPDGSSSGL